MRPIILPMEQWGNQYKKTAVSFDCLLECSDNPTVHLKRHSNIRHTPTRK